MFNQMKQNHGTERKKLHVRLLGGWLLSLLLMAIFIFICYKISAEKESYFEYTQEDVQMLGDLMYAEVGWLYETEKHKDVEYAHILTGSVILHRLESRRWGDTMKEVICAPGQIYQPTLEAIGNIDTPEEVYRWAERLLKHGPEGPEGLIFEAQYVQGEETYWKIDGKIYFGIMNNITKKVEGGKVN